MKKLFLLISVALIGLATVSAQGVENVLTSHPLLERLFFNPLEINEAFSISDPDKIESILKSKNEEFETKNLAQFGTMILVKPNDMIIAECPIAQLAFQVGAESTMIFYFTKPSDKYEDFCKELNSALGGCNKMAENIPMHGCTADLYVIGNDYGVAVGRDNKNKVAMAMMLNIKGMLEMLQSPTSQP